MENMGRKKPRPRRSFTPEFKAEIVELCERGGDRSIGQVARDFDLTETAVREWTRQAELDTAEVSSSIGNGPRWQVSLAGD
jgi:transposase